MSAYSSEVLAHFRNPHGAGRLPEDEADNRSGEARDEEGGQRVRLYLRVGVDGRIARARFQAFGCPIAIAAASAAVARLEGASVAEALTLRAEELARELALTPEQARLAELPLRALRDALAYLRPRP
ncbi:MAG: iron-sulfur cluster assembly scaffold protein [Myxococcota bacterium]